MKLNEASGEASGDKPLAGIRVLAPEQMQAMPYGTQLMAFLGAEVWKVEAPRGGESGRPSVPSLKDEDGTTVGATFMRNNLAKKSIGIDLKSAGGQALFRRLVPHFDVVAENFKPGTMDQWGLGYQALAKLHPGLVYASVSGFGNSRPSPYRDWPAYAPMVQAMTGIFNELARPGEYPPYTLGGPVADIAAALFAVIGILSAVVQRNRTGLGQHVDVAMFDSMLAMADMVPFMWSMGAPHPAQVSAGLVGAFKAKDGYVLVTVLREHQFRNLSELLGKPEWTDDPRFATRAGWVRHRESVFLPALEAWASNRTRLEACAALSARDIPAGPYFEAADLPGDPHLATRNMLIETPNPGGGKPLLIVGNPVKMSGSGDGPVGPWPKVGEHTGEALRSILGMTDPEIAALAAQGVVSGGRT